jgi:hypothetical protein
VATKPITDGVARWVVFYLSHLLVGFVILKQSNVLQSCGAIDEHLTEAQDVLTGSKASIRARLSECPIDLLAKTDLVPESVDEDQPGSASKSFVGLFKLQHRLGTQFVVSEVGVHPTGEKIEHGIQYTNGRVEIFNPPKINYI